MRACVMGLVVFAILGNTVCGVLPTVGLTQKRFFSLANSKELFEDFVSRFHRTYSGAQEYQTRFQIFQETLRQINERNAQEKEAVHGVTRFADRSLEEREKMLGTQVPPPFLSSRFTQNGAGGAYVRPHPPTAPRTGSRVTLGITRFATRLLVVIVGLMVLPKRSVIILFSDMGKTLADCRPST